MTSILFVRRTRATFRSAEFGFLGVVVYTRVQMPRFCGLPRRAGAEVLEKTFDRPFLINWLIVGILCQNPLFCKVLKDNPLHMFMSIPFITGDRGSFTGL